MSCGSSGSRRRSGSHPPGVIRTRVLPGGEPARVVSRGDLEGLANYTLAARGLAYQFAVGLEHQLNGFLEIASGLLERAPLRIRAWEFFDKTDVPFRNLAEYGREFNVHGNIIRRNDEAQHRLAADGGRRDHEPPRLKPHVGRTRNS